MYSALIAIAAVLAAAPDEAQEEAETSLETQTPEEAWASPGFRAGIGYSGEGLFGFDGTPSAYSHVFQLRLGARIEEHWSLLVTLRYGGITGDKPGLRFSGTIEPTLHFDDSWSLTLGLGLGGFVLPNTLAPELEPGGRVIAPYTYPTTDPLLSSCTGTGAMGLVRLEYQFIVGHNFSTGPALQVDTQWTRCTDALNRADADTGESLALHQFWRHAGVSFGWIFWWR